MSWFRGSKIIQNGLVLNLDAKNPKCYSQRNLFVNSALLGGVNPPTGWGTFISSATASSMPSIVDNTQNAFNLVTTNGRYLLAQNVQYNVGLTYTLSCYVESVNASIQVIQLLQHLATNPIFTNFYQNGNIISSVSNITAGSWYSVVVKASITEVQLTRIGNGCSSNTTGDITISSPQFEGGNKASKYQKTTTTPSTLVKDLSPSKNNGTLTNGAICDLGNGVFSFDGVNDYIDCGNILGFDRLDPFTFSAWVNPTSLGSARSIFTKMNNIGVGYIFLFNASGFLQFSMAVTPVATNLLSVRTSSVAVTTNKYTHVAITYNGSSSVNGVKFYVNGVLQTNTTITDGLTASTLNSAVFSIGGRPSTNDLYTNGIISLSMIYNRVLSASEVLNNYNATKSRFLQ